MHPVCDTGDRMCLPYVYGYYQNKDIEARDTGLILNLLQCRSVFLNRCETMAWQILFL